MAANGPLKYFGGKSYLAPHIHKIAQPFKRPITSTTPDPKNRPGWVHRAIPYAGGLSEIWGWDCNNVSEVVNDLDHNLMGFYEVLQNPKSFEAFETLCSVTPFSEPLWQKAHDYLDGVRNGTTARLTSTIHAWYFFVLVRQSFMGMQASFTPLTRTRTRRGMNGDVSAWISAVEGLEQAHRRLRRVVIKCKDAIEFIKEEDTPSTLLYVDPPYSPETRTSKQVYTYEIDEDHRKKLVAALTACKGYVMLSGYSCPIYERNLRNWKKHTFEVVAHSGKSSKKTNRKEIIWTNF